MDALDFQLMGKSLYHRIVVAGPTAAHAGILSAAADEVAVVPATMNAPAVGMHDDASGLTVRVNGYLRRHTGQLSVDARNGRVSDHP